MYQAVMKQANLWGSYCANISARLGCSTLTIHHLNKGALANDSDDAMSHRAEIRGAVKYYRQRAVGDSYVVGERGGLRKYMRGTASGV